MGKSYIVTRSGGEHGMGHAVRMGHLAKALSNPLMITKRHEPGWEYFPALGLVVATDEYLDSGGKTLIVDIPITDNEFLGKYRPYFDNIIVIVGTGWSINPMTRKLADLIVYQGVGEPTKEVLQAPGGAVLYGLEWLILGKEYETRPKVEREDFVLYYCGGGIPEDYQIAVYDEMVKLDLKVYWATGFKYPLYDKQSRCAVQVSTFGMVTYEALTLRTPVVSFSRSEDHAKSEFGLTGWLDAMGKYDFVEPQAIAQHARMGMDWPFRMEYPEELDGKGTQRLVDYILREL
jgi:spore coat polysaccharide biosynthesis predicted glycosyltransferase SpsG